MRIRNRENDDLFGEEEIQKPETDNSGSGLHY